MFISLVGFLGPDKGGRNTCPVFEFDTPYRVTLRLLLPDLDQERFSVGSKVRFYEGSYLVGTGAILEVC